MLESFIDYNPVKNVWKNKKNKCSFKCKGILQKMKRNSHWVRRKCVSAA